MSKLVLMSAIVKGKDVLDTHIFDGLKVCVLDDDTDQLAIVSGLLTQWGAKVRLFEAAPDAIEFLDGNNADLIISDVMMPDVDGWSFFSALRKLPKHQQTPVVFLTCLLDATEEPLFNDPGDLCKTLAKPLRVAQLVAAVVELQSGLN
ncbi:MAG: response regulator [Verrucomicrobia bacterium]|nr:response regulator [Verrucomicrobiota bacterium]